MEGKGLTVILILLVLISAVTACKDPDHVFCFDNCNTTNVTQFCNCVVNAVVQTNDSESLESDTIVSQFERQAEMILSNTTEGPCVWCCTLIIIHQNINLPQGYVFILQFHCTKFDLDTGEFTKYWSNTELLIPFFPPPSCQPMLDFETPCSCSDTTGEPESQLQCPGNSAPEITAIFFINAIFAGASLMML